MSLEILLFVGDFFDTFSRTKTPNLGRCVYMLFTLFGLGQLFQEGHFAAFLGMCGLSVGLCV